MVLCRDTIERSVSEEYLDDRMSDQPSPAEFVDRGLNLRTPGGFGEKGHWHPFDLALAHQLDKSP